MRDYLQGIPNITSKIILPSFFLGEEH